MVADRKFGSIVNSAEAVGRWFGDTLSTEELVGTGSSNLDRIEGSRWLEEELQLRLNTSTRTQPLERRVVGVAKAAHFPSVSDTN